MSVQLPELIKARVRRYGMYQQITFKLSFSGDDVNKTFFYLTDKNVEEEELIRLSNQYGFCFVARNASAYPKNKTSQDFLLSKFKTDDKSQC